MQQKKENESKPSFVIGIIVNAANLEDIAFYNEQFKTINKLYPTKIKLMFFGYRPEDDKHNALKDVNFEYVKPVSINHYFKQFKALNIGLLFIPLMQNIYNDTSENYNKFLEAGIHGVPVITCSAFPYNIVIRDKQNGFIYKKRADFIPYLKEVLATAGLIKTCGETAKQEVLTKFNYSKENISILSNSFADNHHLEDDEEGEEEEQEQETV